MHIRAQTQTFWSGNRLTLSEMNVADDIVNIMNLKMKQCFSFDLFLLVGMPTILGVV